MTNFEIIQLVLIFILVILLILSKYNYLLKHTLYKYNEDEFVVAMKTLDLTLEYYKNNILDPVVIKLQSKYDLNIESKTYAGKAYHDVLKQTHILAIQEIMSKYLNQSTHKILNKYFNDDTLILLMMDNFKSKE